MYRAKFVLGLSIMAITVQLAISTIFTSDVEDYMMVDEEGKEY